MQHDLSLRRCLSVLLGVDIPGGDLEHRQFAAVSGRVGPSERPSHSARSQLGKLERFVGDG